MEFPIGSKVELIHTGDIGLVDGIISGGLIMVKLEDGYAIPVPQEDLRPAIEALYHTEPIKDKASKPEAQKHQHSVKSFVGQMSGIHVAFDPVYNVEGNISTFEVWLINDTSYDFIYDFELSFIEHISIIKEDTIVPGKMVKIGEMEYDRLNDSPKIDLDYWLLSTEGKEDNVHKVLKIKAKQFFAKVKSPFMFHHPVHFFTLVEDIRKEKKSGEGLDNYTLRKSSTIAAGYFPKTEKITIHHSKEFAEFKPEIDLHIDKLVEDYRRLKNAEIIRIQLDSFERFMEKAIRLGVPRVFIVHGVGKGKLRDEIATRLLQLSDVKTFKNEFHPRYGWGATEVEL